MTQIQIDWSKARETARHNVATEEQAVAELRETHRHNITYEKETKRHNVAGEKETKRHNVKVEKETNRHNRKTEGQEDTRLKQETQKIKESKRHNKKTESQEDKRISLQQQKTAADVANINARTVSQELANAADKADPQLYKANRFINFFKANAPAAWLYYGLENLSPTEEKAVNKESSQVNPNNAKIINIIDKANYRKNGKHLSKSAKADWQRILNWASGDGYRTDYQIKNNIYPGKDSKSKTSKSKATKAKDSRKKKPQIPDVRFTI